MNMKRYIPLFLLTLLACQETMSQKFATIKRGDKEVFAFRVSQADTVLFVDEADTTRYDYAAMQAQNDSLMRRTQQLAGLINTDEHTLYTGKWEQKSFTATGLSDNNAANRVTMHDVIAVPYLNAKIRFKLPPNYLAGVRHAALARDLSTNTYWFKDGDSMTFAANDRYYRISLGHYENNTQLACPLDSVLKFMADGRMQFTYEPSDGRSTIARNTDCQAYADTLAWDANCVRILHTSDVHGDARRYENFCQYADYLGVDMSFVTGDLVAYNSSNGCDFISRITKKYHTPTFICAGNHDVNGLTTNEQIYNAVIKDMAETYQYKCPKPNIATQPYYHYDMPDKKLRIISLNLYDGGHPNNTGTICSIYQAQINWFIGLLKELLTDPQYEGYGVVVLMHAPENPILWKNELSAFRQKTLGYWETHKNINGTPITLIINAFIAATQGNESQARINKIYYCTDYQSKMTTVNYTADFTGKVNSNVEFIAYFTGHEHEDLIGYYSAYDGTSNNRYKQLISDVTCNISIDGTSAYPYLTDPCDLPRNAGSITQDAFNYYVIDRQNKVLKVARIGSNYSTDKRERKTMVIPYK